MDRAILDNLIKDFQTKEEEHGRYSEHEDYISSIQKLLDFAVLPTTSNDEKLYIFATLTNCSNYLQDLRIKGEFIEEDIIHVLENPSVGVDVKKTAMYLLIKPNPENIHTFSIFSNMSISNYKYRDIQEAKEYLANLDHYDSYYRNADLLVNYPETLEFWTRKGNWIQVPTEMRDRFLETYFFGSLHRSLPDFISDELKESIISNMSSWDVANLNSPLELASFIKFSGAEEKLKTQSAFKFLKAKNVTDYCNSTESRYNSNMSKYIGIASQQILNSKEVTEEDRKMAMSKSIQGDCYICDLGWNDAIEGLLLPDKQVLAYDLISGNKTLKEVIEMGDEAQDTVINLVGALIGCEDHLLYMIVENKFSKDPYSTPIGFYSWHYEIPQEVANTPFAQKVIAKIIEKNDRDGLKYLNILKNTSFDKKALRELVYTSRAKAIDELNSHLRSLKKAKYHKSQYDAGLWRGRRFTDETPLYTDAVDMSRKEISRYNELVTSLEEQRTVNNNASRVTQTIFPAQQHEPAVQNVTEQKPFKDRIKIQPKPVEEIKSVPFVPKKEIAILAGKLQMGETLNDEEKEMLIKAIKKVSLMSRKEASQGFTYNKNMRDENGALNMSYILEYESYTKITELQRRELLNMVNHNKIVEPKTLED